MTEIASDEISISEILGRLWNRRGLLFLFPALAILLAVVFLAVVALQTKNPVVYFVSLKGVENGHYPNGTDFSPTDLLIPPVIADVAKRFEITDLNKFRRAFSVRYGSILEPSVNQKYRAMLAASGLTTPEIDAINTAYESELSKIVRSGLRIEFDYEDLGLDAPTGAAVVAALPESWGKIYPTLYKVFSDTKLADASIFIGGVKLDNVANLLLADNYIKNIGKGLQIIASDNRLNSIETSSGEGVADLLQALQAYRTRYFDPIFASSLGDSGAVGRAYIQQTIFEVDNLKRRLSGYNDTISVLRSFQQSPPPTVGSEGAAPGDTIQLGEGALAQIVQLSDRASLAQYLRETLDHRQELVEQLSEMQKELDILRNQNSEGDRMQVTEAAETQLSALLASYREVLTAARSRLRERVGELFVPANSPAVVGSRIPPRSLIVLVLSLMIGIFAGAAIALLTPRRNKHASA